MTALASHSSLGAHLGGTDDALGAAEQASRPEVDTFALSYRDEESVIWHRAGHSAQSIARCLGHDLATIQAALVQAIRLRITLTTPSLNPGERP